MRLNEFISKNLPFDVIDDAVVFMRNDPIFYRKHYYPAISKVADLHRSGKPIQQNECLSDMVEAALESYCKKYQIGSIPDDVFSLQDRNSIIEKIFSEEMEQIKKGEYK